MVKWVQHISGKGKKWEVMNSVRELEWRVKADGPAFYYDLPMLEYKKCDPPEEWEDVTSFHQEAIKKLDMFLAVDTRVTYRDCMHNGPHFIIERKKS